ncbi:uncharacterized protein LOC106656462 [Trichogramma pretiosum]|uniref:uncharacterized protein LOC106656462 n=1 Tax=Trichogramma pretiosum TaxID=7493 RepID=UPI000C718C91|nr:uncharacterized protein LOC106656462 [Trichogramma pretiosum]
MASTICCMFSYKEVKTWMSVKTLKNFITAQNDLHQLVKQCLKILRRVYRKRSNPLFLQEKNSLLGNRKLNIVTSMKQALIEIFENLSSIYYEQAQDIYEFLPDKMQLNCILTKIEFESDKDSNERSYEDMKSLYYTFILVQSELLFIIANTYNAKEINTYGVPNNKLLQIIKSLTNLLDIYHTKLTKLYIEYQKTEVKPVKRVFRGLPNSKWQDTYIHLDLTSQRIQSAFQEISSILEYIDTHAEYDEDNTQLAEFATDKMNEAYKMIEQAKNFAEFSSLLIAKAQKKAVKDVEKEENNENLFPLENDNRRVVVIDDYPEIQDEVFEEYIREEYIRPLIESSEGIMESFKLDKLLKKNFMSELKEVLIEKQRTMKERELKALKRMYNKVRRDSCASRIEPEMTKCGENLAASVPKLPGTTSTPKLKDLTIVETENDERLEDKEFSTSSRPAPPPPSLPLPSLEDPVSFESFSDDSKEEKKSRKPVPLPRVKMLNTNDEIGPLQRFSITQITPNFKLPASFIKTEETFVGSGENSDEEYVKSDSEDDDVVEN